MRDMGFEMLPRGRARRRAPRAAAKALLRFALLALVAGCSTPPRGPKDRIEAFSGCRVPAGVIEVDDDLQGVERATLRARVVLEREQVEAFVRSCGFAPRALREGARPPAITPEPAIAFWRLPPPEAWVAGASRPVGDAEHALLLFHRDTDVVMFVAVVPR